MEFDDAVELMKCSGNGPANFLLDHGYKLLAIGPYTNFRVRGNDPLNGYVHRGTEYTFGRPKGVAHVDFPGGVQRYISGGGTIEDVQRNRDKETQG